MQNLNESMTSCGLNMIETKNKIFQILKSQNQDLPKSFENKILCDMILEPGSKLEIFVKTIRQRELLTSPVGFWVGGKPGVGKTHLLLALMNEIAWNYFHAFGKIDNQIKFWTYSDLCSELRDDPNNFQKFRALRSPEFLFIDDVGTSKASDFIQEKFYSIINYRNENGLPTFVTTNLSIDEIGAEFSERMTSRIKESAIWLDLKDEKDFRNNHYRDNLKQFIFKNE